MKKIYVGMDFGNDTYKIVINGMRIKIPYAITRYERGRTGDSNDTTATRDDYIRHMTVSENDFNDFNDYIVGAVARYRIYAEDSIVTAQKARMSEIESQANKTVFDEERKELEDLDTRYTSRLFIIGFEAVFGYAFVEYMKENPEYKIEDLGEYDIRIMGIYPHAIVDTEIGLQSARMIKGEHKYKLQIGKTVYDFKYKVNKAYRESQAMCSFFSMVYDEKGNIDNADPLKSLPLLLIDGGYGTTGFVLMNQGGVINREETESNDEYTMKEIHNDVAKELARKYKYVTTFRAIHTKMQLKDYDIRVNYVLDEITGMYTEKVKRISIEDLYKDCLRKKVQTMVEYLKVKYPNYYNFKGVYIAGGSGSEYINYFREFTSNIFLPEDIVLTAREFCGQPPLAVYAIAEGGYKRMLNRINNEEPQAA